MPKNSKVIQDIENRVKNSNLGFFSFREDDLYNIYTNADIETLIDIIKNAPKTVNTIYFDSFLAKLNDESLAYLFANIPSRISRIVLNIDKQRHDNIYQLYQKIIKANPKSGVVEKDILLEKIDAYEKDMQERLARIQKLDEKKYGSLSNQVKPIQEKLNQIKDNPDSISNQPELVSEEEKLTIKQNTFSDLDISINKLLIDGFMWIEEDYILEFNLKEITNTNFPTEFIEERSPANIVFNNKLWIRCGNLSPDVLTQANLEKFCEGIKERYAALDLKPTHYIQLLDMDKLSNEDLYQLISNEYFVSLLDETTLINLIQLSDRNADYASTNAAIIARLNTIHAQEDKQTFHNSCAARSLMRLLLEKEIITQEQYTNSKELSIYRQIWSAPSENSDPGRIATYLESMNIEFSGGTIADVTAALFEKSPQLLAIFNIFEKSSKQMQKHSTFTEDQFADNSIFLLAIGNSIESSHIIFCKKTNGMVAVFDPGSGHTTSYQSMKDVFQNFRSLGAYYQIPIQPKLESQLKV